MQYATAEVFPALVKATKQHNGREFHQNQSFCDTSYKRRQLLANPQIPDLIQNDYMQLSWSNYVPLLKDPDKIPQYKSISTLQVSTIQLCNTIGLQRQRSAKRMITSRSSLIKIEDKRLSEQHTTEHEEIVTSMFCINIGSP